MATRLLTTVGGGVRMNVQTQYLAGFRGTSYPTVPSTARFVDAAFDGTIDDLATAYPELKSALYNDIKSCEKCGKPCAYTMTACNSCGSSLEATPITKSENVFMAFLFGVRTASKGFPYTISLRRETPEALIIDDLLALTPCHFNAIPKNYHIPDWRFLLKSPALGLKLLDIMEEELWAATLPFLQNKDFRDYMYKDGFSEEDIRSKIIRMFNFPPSQFQLHIQWLVPPLIPFQHYMAEIGNHFHEGRAFPVDYVRACLSFSEPFPDITINTPIKDIIGYYDKNGVNYNDHWTVFYSNALKSSTDFANWNVADFQYLAEGGRAHEFVVTDGEVVLGKEVARANLGDVTTMDKTLLQNYGRPYSDTGKAFGTYVTSPLKACWGEGGLGVWPPARL